MKIYFVLVTLLLVSLLTKAESETAIPLLSIKHTHWSNEEVAFIKALNRKGSLKIATKLSSAIYMPHKDGSTGGFHCGVLKEFAELAKSNLDIQTVSWDEYFYKESEYLTKVKSDPNYSYVPTLIENVDLYLDGFTKLPCREKMFDIIANVPTRQMIISRKDNKPHSMSDLNNKVCAMVRHSSMESKLESIKINNQLNFTYEYTEIFDAMDTLVSEGKADFTVYDSDRAFLALSRYKNLTIAWPISEPQIMGWAINKENKLLKSILDKYIIHAQQSGILDKYWKRSYGVTFVEYLQILKLGGAAN
ncbi:MAG: membrane-bound lytic murein transglycosylase MltF [Paraglaciecola sp.]|jgi:membrane-bound lytic murein transglycosylase MltF